MADHFDRGPTPPIERSTTSLAGRVFEWFVVDIVTERPGSLVTETVPLGRLLQFAGSPVVEIAVIDLRVHFAEKLSAYLRRYDDRPNTRVKDLVDLALLIEHGLPADHALRSVVERDVRCPTTSTAHRLAPFDGGGVGRTIHGDGGGPWPHRTTATDAHALVDDFWQRAQRHHTRQPGHPQGEPLMARAKKQQAPQTTQARLRSVINSARKTMRKDAGLNGDLDRIPQLAWLLFLKAFDGLEEEREVIEDDYRSAIEPPYRWRDWAADRLTGSPVTTCSSFVNDKLLQYLRDLKGDTDRDPRDVLATVFKETYNRMVSGYLLSDVIEQINKVDFTSSDDVHTMALLYESMLREMRDAAGDSGEFYTPRSAIRFMVQMIDPRLGDVVLDPACGTGGFLVEAWEHLRPQLTTVAEREQLAENLRGVEKKALPYLLGMMNLLLHGLSRPNLVRGNALARPLTEIKRAEKVDVILTNPPFGGEEEKSILSNFPAGTQTAETAWLFMQLVQRMLADDGRCAIVVPNGVLFADGAGAADQARPARKLRPSHRGPARLGCLRPLHRHPLEPPVL